jgi:NAD(P)-dependent dehydrogenase (short-subunit alcohol dehydrogenase family)
MISTRQDFRLEGRVAVVTGASSGIGAAIAVALAAAGAKVIAVGREAQRLQATVGKIIGLGHEAHGVVAELTDFAGARAVVDTTIERYGRMDVLVHSAGIFIPATFVDATCEELDRHWKVNVRAPFELTQVALAHLGPGSSVIFITSTVARVGFANTATYSASKAAVDGMMRVMAIELAPRGICVNGIAPGWTATPMNETLREDGDVVAAAIAATPAGRLAVPEDIAPSVVFLASTASRFVQGIVLDVGGGYPSLPDVIRKGAGSPSAGQR